MLEVGPGKTYALPSAAAAVAQSGDTIRIAAGDYRGDVTTWSAANLAICGVGGRARLYADGKNAGGKGIWVVKGVNVTIDSIEFHDATVPDQNGAGIRAENTGTLSIRNCGFFDNEDGMLGPDAASATVSIDGSEFARNGYGDGQSHNLYVGSVAGLVVTNSFFHEARIGHNFKSRAKQTRIEGSYFMDGPDGTASYEADFPNGGAVVLRGNLFHKGPNADNGTAIAFGAEGLLWPTNTLEMVHNTVVMTRSGGAFLYVDGGTQSVTLTANLFAGTDSPSLISGFSSARTTQTRTVTGRAAHVPGADTIANPSFWPDATLQAQIGLASPLDPGYTADTPQPFTPRAIATNQRVVGALQSAP